MEDSRMKRPFFLATIFGAKARSVGGAVKIVIDDVAPVGILHLQERNPALDRGVRHHDIDLSVVALDLVRDLAQRADVPYVRLYSLTAPAERFDDPDRMAKCFDQRGGIFRP
jgi:hypothetical protein